MAFDIEMIKAVYAKFPQGIERARTLVGKPLTLAEKILYTHLWNENNDKAFSRGVDYVDFGPPKDSFSTIAVFNPNCEARMSVALIGALASLH